MRVHVEILAQFAEDAALQEVFGERDIAQNDDLLSIPFGPSKVTLAASAVATEVDLPIGASALRFLVVDDVEGSGGINIHLGGAGIDPILVKQSGTDANPGFLALQTDAVSIHVSNPAATAVSAKIMIACV